MRNDRMEEVNEMMDESRAERELFCMTCIMDGPRGESIAALAAVNEWDDLGEEAADILTHAMQAENAEDYILWQNAKRRAGDFIDDAISEFTPLDEFAVDEIEKALDVEAEHTGGGIYCFIFHKEGDPVEKSLMFGWANGGLGFQVYDNETGDEGETGELPAGSATDAQVRFIKETAARLGYTIPDACAIDPHMTEEGAEGVAKEAAHTPGPWAIARADGAPIIYQEGKDSAHFQPSAICEVYRYGGTRPTDANARLIAASPDMLAALLHAAEIIKTARGYFPKSIKNPDRFALELAAAEIGKALHRAQEVR